MKRFILVFVLALCLTAGALSAQEATPEATPQTPTSAEMLALLASLPSSRGPDGAFLLGDPNAPRTLIEFADWACPHCQDYRPVIDAFIAQHVANGDANFEFRIFPTAGGARTVLAGQAAECADNQRPGAFWEAWVTLYDLAAAGQYENVADQLAAALDLDAEALNACLPDADQVNIDMNYAREYGIGGTPGVLARSGDGQPIPIRIDGFTYSAGGVPPEALEAFVQLAVEDMIDPQIALNEAFLAENATADGVQVTDSGLQYRVDIAGEDGATPGPDEIVTVNYVASFIDGTQFDSSADHDEAAIFPLNAIIPGLSEGIQLMTPGSTYTFWLPPELAYGAAGNRGVIPANAILVFEVELLSTGDPTVQANQAFLEQNAQQEGVVTTDSGLQYRIDVEGDGSATPALTDTVVINYEGFLTDGTKFDSSIDRGTPAEFPVNGLIPGFTEGLMLMSPGTQITLWIPPELGYGARGVPGVIPANSVLEFHIELLEIQS